MKEPRALQKPGHETQWSDTMSDNNNTPIKRCRKCEKEFPATSEFFYLVKGKPGSYCKPCHLENCKEWREKHPDQWQKTNRANAKKVRERKRLDPARNHHTGRPKTRPAKVKKCCRCGFECTFQEAPFFFKHGRNRRDGLSSWCKNCAAKNVRSLTPEQKQQRRIAHRQWQLKHIVENRAKARRYYARKRGAEGKHTAADVVLQIKAQTDKRGVLHCWWCGKPINGNDYQVDHAIPLNRGGSDNPSNIVVSHGRCNSSKRDQTPAEYLGRLF